MFLRSDYFRNFVDSCLQKIAQDRPTSDVLLKVQALQILLAIVYRCSLSLEIGIVEDYFHDEEKIRLGNR